MSTVFLDPTSELSPDTIAPLPRLASLQGATVGLLDINKPRVDVRIVCPQLQGVTQSLRPLPGDVLADDRRINLMTEGSPQMQKKTRHRGDDFCRIPVQLHQSGVRVGVDQGRQ